MFRVVARMSSCRLAQPFFLTTSPNLQTQLAQRTGELDRQKQETSRLLKKLEEQQARFDALQDQLEDQQNLVYVADSTPVVSQYDTLAHSPIFKQFFFVLIQCAASL